MSGLDGGKENEEVWEAEYSGYFWVIDRPRRIFLISFWPFYLLYAVKDIESPLKTALE